LYTSIYGNEWQFVIFILGRSYKILGEHDTTVQAYEKALALAPGDPEIRELHQAATQLLTEAKR
jgi:cytochrome c-type biogenesis protein CcmH/NrfG